MNSSARSSAKRPLLPLFPNALPWTPSEENGIRRGKLASLWKWFHLGGIAGALLAPFLCVAQTTVWNLDFNTPSSRAPIVFGAPTPLPTFGGLNDRPLRFHMAGNPPSFFYDQIELALPRTSDPITQVDFDFASGTLVGSRAKFTVLFDTPTVRNVLFRNDGSIALYGPTLDYFGEGTTGSFMDGSTFHVRIVVDAIEKTWSVYTAGKLIATTPFQADDYISSVRFSYGLVTAGTSSDDSAVAIDNLVVRTDRKTPAIHWRSPAPLVYGIPLSALQLSATADIPGVFTYAPTAGIVLNAGVHPLSVTFVPSDTLRYTTATSHVDLAVSPFISIQPQAQTTEVGKAIVLTTAALGSATLGFHWKHNGDTVAGATSSALTIDNVQPRDAGVYYAVATSGGVSAVSKAAVVGVQTRSKVIGSGIELLPADIQHPNGNVFDQVLITGAAEAVTADHALGQITRTSYVDLNDDIVQVELSGPGTLSIVLAEHSGPALAKKYDQSVMYMKGHAGIVITGATEQTNLTIFSVGTATAVNASLFKSGMTYDGMADMAFVAISSIDGKFGGVRTGNVRFYSVSGLTGLYAPGVQFTGPVYIGDITAFDTATPVLVVGSALDETRITGGDLGQENLRAVEVSGITRLTFAAGTDSHGNPMPAKRNAAILVQNGHDVTNSIVADPTD